MTHTILVADDDPKLREPLAELLRDQGYSVTTAGDGNQVLDVLFSSEISSPDLVLLDIQMPGSNGIEVLKKLKDRLSGPLPVIVMTAFGSSRLAIECIQLGAYDYLTKPFDFEDVAISVRRFLERVSLAEQIVDLSRNDRESLLVGDSQAMQEVYKAIGRTARSDATVLITGETGTGKELVAKSIHSNSQFARGPLINVNCGALPETLLDSELFGHEKGAFTGASNQRKGRFERANKGTIFLDEVGECSLATQKRLLRVLQDREIERVGGTSVIKVDTRVISATNKPLIDAIEGGTFREDLYYRLNVVAIHIPPLRERREDIILLVEHFLDKHRYTANSSPSRISQSALDKLVSHNWPGNVRELDNVISRAVLLSQGSVITEREIAFSHTEHLNLIDVASRLKHGESLADLQKTLERLAILSALRLNDGDRERAAAMLGVEEEEIASHAPSYS